MSGRHLAVDPMGQVPGPRSNPEVMGSVGSRVRS